MERIQCLADGRENREPKMLARYRRVPHYSFDQFARLPVLNPELRTVRLEPVVDVILAGGRQVGVSSKQDVVDGVG